jgi:hypothetical protein
MSGRDEWREQLAGRLLGTAAVAPNDFSPTAPTALEIAFGHARSEVTYVLELARAHAVPARGSVIGDDISLRLGEGVLRFHISRREQTITATVPGRDEERLHWDAARRTMALSDGSAIEMKPFVRGAIDAVVNGFRQKSPSQNPRASTVRDLPVTKPDEPVEDEKD